MGGEEDDRQWDGWMASLTWWTWVWASSGSWWWTRKPGVLQSMGSQRVRHDLSTKQQQKMPFRLMIVSTCNGLIRTHAHCKWRRICSVKPRDWCAVLLWHLLGQGGACGHRQIRGLWWRSLCVVRILPPGGRSLITLLNSVQMPQVKGNLKGKMCWEQVVAAGVTYKKKELQCLKSCYRKS